MRNRSYISSLTALFVLVIAIGLIGLACGKITDNNANNANNTMTPVTTPDLCTNQMITDAIYIKLMKAGLASPLKQINVGVDAGMVTLTGFVNNSAEKAIVVGIVENTSCVKKPVNVDKFYDCAPGPPVQPDNVGGCGPGWYRCGDICVPNRCFWNDAPAPGTTPSPLPSSSITPCPSTTPTLTPKPSPDSNSNKQTSTSNKY